MREIYDSSNLTISNMILLRLYHLASTVKSFLEILPRVSTTFWKNLEKISEVNERIEIQSSTSRFQATQSLSPRSGNNLLPSLNHKSSQHRPLVSRYHERRITRPFRTSLFTTHLTHSVLRLHFSGNNPESLESRAALFVHENVAMHWHMLTKLVRIRNFCNTHTWTSLSSFGNAKAHLNSIAATLKKSVTHNLTIPGPVRDIFKNMPSHITPSRSSWMDRYSFEQMECHISSRKKTA